jgi:hypothetical protein
MGRSPFLEATDTAAISNRLVFLRSMEILVLHLAVHGPEFLDEVSGELVDEVLQGDRLVSTLG